METLLQALPIVLYVLGAILLVVLIILGIHLIGSVTRMNRILDDVEEKVNSLDSLFHIINTVSTAVSTFTDNVAGTISKMVTRFFKKKMIEEEEEEENE